MRSTRPYLPFCLVAALAAPRDVAAQALGEKATESMAYYYEQADHWALKGIVLLALGETWHPVGRRIVLDALRDRDKRLRAFGIEALRRTKPAHLPAIVDAELLDELVRKQTKERNKLYRERVLEVLGRVVPDAGERSPSQWQSWWSKAKKEYAPAEWQGAGEVAADRKKGGTTVVPFVERAFDLNAAGLDVAIVIDSTGSMQPTIDTARDALAEIVLMLRGIAPKLRLGLAHYRDFEDFSDGARLLLPMTRNVKSVQDKLGKLVAAGGGDMPERVEKGLEIAYGREMRWKKETNKVVLVIGDAPPHSDKIDDCIELAKNAYERPLQDPRVVTTGPRKKDIRPIVTSTIIIGQGPAHDQGPDKWFKQIAEAGGGSSGKLDIGAESHDEAVSKIVEHILALSYGAQWESQMRAFVKIFQAYRRAGFVRIR